MVEKRTAAEFIGAVDELIEEIQQLYLHDKIPWIIGVSWGKDSSAIVQLVWSAIAALPPERWHKPIHLISTDTQVENPIVAAWVNKCIDRVGIKAAELNLPIRAHLLRPEVKDSFWVNLVGRGYGSPNGRFRWCTERLKINPSNRFIRETIHACGETILVLGTRKTESIARGARMAKHQQGRVRDKLTPNAQLINSLIYTPIEDWTTDEVWMYLMQSPNPWGGNNRELFELYRGATADNECPLVIDTNTPSCGSSRFGCWVCTVVERDKSMEALVDNNIANEWLHPLLDLRNELAKDDKHKRDFRRMHGGISFGTHPSRADTNIPGPYTKYWREDWLRRLLSAQAEIQRTAPPQFRDLSLISNEELSEIRRIWLDEKHEFDDSLPAIFEEIAGKPFQERRAIDCRSLGRDEWSVLAEICGDDAMHLELMAKLLDTEQQHQIGSRRDVFKNLEKHLASCSRSAEEAIDFARIDRDLRTAAAAGDIAKIKTLNIQLQLEL